MSPDRDVPDPLGVVKKFVQKKFVTCSCQLRKSEKLQSASLNLPRMFQGVFVL